jgi:hypothetical protein
LRSAGVRLNILTYSSKDLPQGLISGYIIVIICTLKNEKCTKIYNYSYQSSNGKGIGSEVEERGNRERRRKNKEKLFRLASEKFLACPEKTWKVLMLIANPEVLKVLLYGD